MDARTSVVAVFLAALAFPAFAQVVAPAARAAQACTVNGLPCDPIASDAFLAAGAGRMGQLGLVANTVNNLAGTVTLPTYSRQVSASTPVTTGIASFTFATPFANTPTCFAEVQSTSTGYVFASPVITSKDTTQVTMNVQAALKTLNISLGALAVWTNAPAGTTLNITCIAQN